ncbi:MAG: siphovirus Gp157 family protein [Chloroflexi bacterium]|nr:siphovirus Gp157 family protein [Chloroflexota bacterium]
MATKANAAPVEARHTTYEITAALSDALAAMDYLEEQVDARAAEIRAAGGELPPDLAEYERAVLERIEQLAGEGLAKLENIALVRRDLALRRDVEGTNKAHMSAEAGRYLRRQQAVERTIDRLKGLSASLFRAMGVQRHDGERIKTRVQRGPMRIAPMHGSSAPAEYCVDTWSMRGPHAEDVHYALVDAGRAGLLAGIERGRAFVPELAKADAQEALNARALLRGEDGEPVGEARPGERIALPDLGIVVEFGTTVVDW